MASRQEGKQQPSAAGSILLPLLLLTLLSTPVLASASIFKSEAVGGASECPRIGRILSLLSSLVDFYATDPDGINADGYFGMSMSQDVLRAVRLEESCQEHVALLRSVLNRQQLLDQRWKRRLNGKSRYDTVTYTRICKPLADLVRHLTGILKNSRLELNPIGDPLLQGAAAGKENLGDRIDIIRQLVQYYEAIGDTCLFKALRPGCPKGKICPYFDRPLDKASGYYLTHQLVYKIVRAMTTCPTNSAVASAITPESIPHELALMCSKALNEYHLIGTANWTAVALQAGDEIVTGLRDLYMEQALICGLLGISSFYHRQAVDRVASWQDPNTGCFKMFRSGEAPSSKGGASSGFRRILRDVEMQDGCSSHSSGIAMGFYSNAIRFLASR